MGKAYSEFFDVTVDGNMLIRHNCDLDTIKAVANNRPQLSVLRTGGDDHDPRFDISHPMDSLDHSLFAALIRVANAQDVKKKVDSKGGKPDNDPTPPTGGTLGSMTRLFELAQTNAIAA